MKVASKKVQDGRTVIEVHLNASEPAPSHKVLDHRRVDLNGFLPKGKQPVLCAQDSMISSEVLHWQRHAQWPSAIKEQIAEARKWAKQLFLRGLNRAKRTFYNYRFGLEPADDDLTARQKEQWKKWHRENEAKCTRLARDCWGERMNVSNVVVFWRRDLETKTPLGKVFLLPPEKCEYKDLMGVETLSVSLQWNTQSYATVTVGRKKNAIDDRYLQGGPIQLDEKFGEYFRVLKDDPFVGSGFAVPHVETLVRVLARIESLEVGDQLSAWLTRAVIRQFKIGHEITGGPMAGRPIHFLEQGLNKGMIKATKELYEGKVGIINAVNNFDNEIVFPYLDMERFGAAKYEGGRQSIMDFVGAIGLFYQSKFAANAPMILELLQAEAEDERSVMKPFLEDVINAAFTPPVRAQVRWGNEIFTDTRIMAEAVKYLHAAGGLSVRTLLEHFGFEQQREWERKDVEDKQPEHRKMPGYDPAHGPVEETGGRPAGTRDSGSRVQLNGDQV